MTDIPRSRQSLQARFGMTVPTEVVDPVARQLIQELQDNIEYLSGQTATSAEPVAETPGYDDSSVLRKLRIMADEIDYILRLLRSHGHERDALIYEAASKAALPEVDSPAIGFVTAGGDINRYFTRSGSAESGSWIYVAIAGSDIQTVGTTNTAGANEGVYANEKHGHRSQWLAYGGG